MSRGVTILAAAAIAASLAGEAAPPKEAKTSRADRIFVNGRVWTGEPVTRTTVEGTPPGGWEPSQRLDAEAALRHFTRDSAFAEHAEEEKGTLAVGKLADFVVLSQGLHVIPPERIKDTRVPLTALGGQDTWRAREF